MFAVQAQASNAGRRPCRADFDGERRASCAAEIERLTAANRAAPDRAHERRLLRLRHIAGVAAARRRRRPAPSTRSPTSSGCPTPTGCPEIAAGDLTPALLRAGHPARRLPARARARRRATRRSRSRGQIDRVVRRARARPGDAGAAGYYEEFEPAPALRRDRRAAVDQGGRRRARRGLAAAQLRDARAVPRGRRARARRGLPRRAAADARSRRRRCARPSRRSAAPGTRTARSWARSARSTSGSRCRAAATSRPGSTSCRAGSTTSSTTGTDEAMLDLPGVAARGGGGRRRQADRAADLRAGRRAVLRRAVPAPDGLGPRRCPSRASRSRTGSSAARPSRPSTSPLAV